MMGKGIQWEKKKKDQTDGPSAIKKEDNLTAASLQVFGEKGIQDKRSNSVG